MDTTIAPQVVLIQHPTPFHAEPRQSGNGGTPPVCIRFAGRDSAAYLVKWAKPGRLNLKLFGEMDASI
jgi:hypothetical protein